MVDDSVLPTASSSMIRTNCSSYYRKFCRIKTHSKFTYIIDIKRQIWCIPIHAPTTYARSVFVIASTAANCSHMRRIHREGMKQLQKLAVIFFSCTVVVLA